MQLQVIPSRVAAICATLAGLVALGAASPTSLSIIPIAEVLRHREAFAALYASGSGGPGRSQIQHTNALTVGLFDRVELGFDNDYRRTSTWNAKALLVETPSGQMVSAGWMNASGKAGDPYLVVQAPLTLGSRSARLHAGVGRFSGVGQGFLGLDMEVSDDLVAALEHISGSSGYTWLGVWKAIPKVEGLELGLSYGHPNRRSNGTQFYAMASLSFRF